MGSNGSSLHYPQIKRNLGQLRVGILALEAKEGSTAEAAKLLRNQYDRMRAMLWEEERAEIPGLVFILFCFCSSSSASCALHDIVFLALCVALNILVLTMML